MGSDVEVYLLHGFKLPLSVAFKSKLIDPNILNSDDYQLIGEDELRNCIIDKYVVNDALKNILKDKWNIYILTSSQDDPDIDKSYFFLYDKRQELFYGSSPDYETGEVIFANSPEISELSEILLSDAEWTYNIHWVVEQKTWSLHDIFGFM